MCWEVRTGGRDAGYLGKTVVEVLLSGPCLRERRKKVGVGGPSMGLCSNSHWVFFLGGFLTLQ